MRHGIPTCVDPDKPECLYMRNLFHEWFWGPFKDEKELVDALNVLDKADPYWDYDPFCIIYGMNRLPKDYVFGFKCAPDEMKERIYAARTINNKQ